MLKKAVWMSLLVVVSSSATAWADPTMRPGIGLTEKSVWEGTWKRNGHADVKIQGTIIEHDVKTNKIVLRTARHIGQGRQDFEFEITKDGLSLKAITPLGGAGGRLQFNQVSGSRSSKDGANQFNFHYSAREIARKTNTFIQDRLELKLINPKPGN